MEQDGFWGLVREKSEGRRNITVYNMEVEDDHSYTADGIAVHNCQAFSIAGLRQALDDPRGQLMLEYLRACHEIDPEWVVWENVLGVLSADRGRAFGSFLAAVAELWPDGGAAWRVLDSQFHGVAQRRERVFVVVNTRDWRRCAPVLFERESLCWDHPSSREKRQSLTHGAAGGVGNADDRDGDGGCLDAVTLKIRGGCDGGGKGPLVQTDMSATLGTRNDQTPFTDVRGVDGLTVRRLTPVECERLQGFPDGWTDIPWKGKPHAPDGPRYKALGNSMAVPVMRWIGQGIQLVEDSREAHDGE